VSPPRALTQEVVNALQSLCTLTPLSEWADPSFKAPLSRNPIGTGPYTLAELRVNDRCILKRVLKTTDGKDFHYWGGEVFLDEIHMGRTTLSAPTMVKYSNIGRVWFAISFQL
jgi:hypothetical protein